MLKKLIIKSFSDNKFKKAGPEFEVPINPEQYSRTFKVEYDKSQAQGGQGNDPKFKKAPPEELKLDFTLDGTNTMQGYALKGKDVSEQMKLLLKVVYNMDGESHKPKYLQVIWDELIFECVLTNLQVNYTLFNNDGSPLRAKVSATFLQYIEQEKRVKKQDKKSPDLTRRHLIKEKEGLPLLCFEYYGDPSFYLETAKVNDLTNFRELNVNQQLVFPPIDKTTQ